METMSSSVRVPISRGELFEHVRWIERVLDELRARHHPGRSMTLRRLFVAFSFRLAVALRARRSEACLRHLVLAGEGAIECMPHARRIAAKALLPPDVSRDLERRLERVGTALQGSSLDGRLRP